MNSDFQDVQDITELFRYTVQSTKDTDTMHYVHCTDNQRHRYHALCTLYRQPKIQIQCTMYTVQTTKYTDIMHYVHCTNNQRYRYNALCTLYRQPKIPYTMYTVQTTKDTDTEEKSIKGFVLLC